MFIVDKARLGPDQHAFTACIEGICMTKSHQTGSETRNLKPWAHELAGSTQENILTHQHLLVCSKNGMVLYHYYIR